MKKSLKYFLLLIGVICWFIDPVNNHLNNTLSDLLSIIQSITGIYFFYLLSKIFIFIMAEFILLIDSPKANKKNHDTTDYANDDDRYDDGFGTFNNEYGGYNTSEQNDFNDYE